MPQPADRNLYLVGENMIHIVLPFACFAIAWLAATAVAMACVCFAFAKSREGKDSPPATDGLY